MIDERKEAQASMYVVGGLPPEEAQEFEQSLRTDLEMQLLVSELRAAADSMVVAFPRVQPPPDLKLRILSSINSRGTATNVVALPGQDFGNWMVWVPWALAACFALLCIILLGTSTSLRRQMADLRQEIEQVGAVSAEAEQQRQEVQTVIHQVTNYQQRIVDLQAQLSQRNQEHQREVTRLEDQLKQTANQAQAQRVPLLRQIQEQEEFIDDLKDAVSQATAGTSDRFAQTRAAALLPAPQSTLQAVGAAVFDAIAQQGMVVVEKLPPLQNQDYQLWLFDPRFATPVSAGVFGTDAQGRARYEYRTAFAVEAVDRFAISIERKGGAPVPQGAIVMQSN